MENKKPLSAPKIPVSWGELIDKITILEIKKTKISNEESLKNIEKELGYLVVIALPILLTTPVVKELKDSLSKVNLRLWQVEDDIRELELRGDFSSEFIRLARSVYRLNDERARLKKKIDHELRSELSEEKGYKGGEWSELVELKAKTIEFPLGS